MVESPQKNITAPSSVKEYLLIFQELKKIGLDTGQQGIRTQGMPSEFPDRA